MTGLAGLWRAQFSKSWATAKPPSSSLHIVIGNHITTHRCLLRLYQEPTEQLYMEETISFLDIGCFCVT